MPDARLERTRNPEPKVPACIRLGHLWQEHYSTGDRECFRCHLIETGYERMARGQRQEVMK